MTTDKTCEITIIKGKYWKVIDKLQDEILIQKFQLKIQTSIFFIFRGLTLKNLENHKPLAYCLALFM